MTITEIIFFAFGGLTAAAAVALSMTKKLMYAAFLLFIVLFGMAAMFVFAGAEFLAVSQVIVYVGGILILVLFGVMLTQKIRGEEPRTEVINLIPGIFVAGGLFAAFIFLIRSIDVNNLSWIAKGNTIAPSSDVEAIGVETVTDFLLPFEAVSILLLAALIGAAYISRRATPKKEDA